MCLLSKLPSELMFVNMKMLMKVRREREERGEKREERRKKGNTFTLHNHYYHHSGHPIRMGCRMAEMSIIYSTIIHHHLLMSTTQIVHVPGVAEWMPIVNFGLRSCLKQLPFIVKFSHHQWLSLFRFLNWLLFVYKSPAREGSQW